MGKKQIIGLAIVTAGAALLLFLTGRKKKAPEIKLLPQPDDYVSREISDAERKKIAAEYGRKGAEKSAQVRRAKKAAKEAAEKGVENVSAN